MIDLNDELVHFVIGSSFFITIFPVAYIFYAHSTLTEVEKARSRISLHTLTLILPIIFGLLLATVYRCIGFVPRKYGGSIYLRYIVAGSISSLLISLGCHYILHIQDEWMHMENPQASHVVVPIFYFGLFYTIGLWLRAQLLYGSSSPEPIITTSNTASSVFPSSSNETFNTLAAIAKSKSGTSKSTTSSQE